MIKVCEYGIINRRTKKISPSHYNWDYCIKNRIPYIIIRPKTKYSNIDYDLLPIENGISFQKGKSLIEHWWKIYEDYVKESSLPQTKIPLRIINNITDNFTVFKKDQIHMVERLMKELEYFVNEYGIIDPERKKYFEMIRKSHEKNARLELKEEK